MKFDKLIRMRRCKKWSREEVIRTIKEFHRKEIPLNFGYVTKDVIAVANFGSGKNAINAAGLDYSKIEKQTEVVKEIKRLYEKGVDVSTREARKIFQTLYAASIRSFNSWKEAVAASGIRIDANY